MTVFEGNWSYGEKHGPGTSYHVDKSKCFLKKKWEGEWQNDRLIRGKKFDRIGTLVEDLNRNGDKEIHNFYNKKVINTEDGGWKCDSRGIPLHSQEEYKQKQYRIKGDRKFLEYDVEISRHHVSGIAYHEDGKTKRFEGEWRNGAPFKGKFYNAGGILEHDGYAANQHLQKPEPLSQAASVSQKVAEKEGLQQPHDGKLLPNGTRVEDLELFTPSISATSEKQKRSQSGVSPEDVARNIFEVVLQQTKPSGTRAEFDRGAETLPSEERPDIASGRRKTKVYRSNDEGKREDGALLQTKKFRKDGTLLYEGEVSKDGKRNGRGTSFHEDGITPHDVGEWKNDDLCGPIISYLKDGSICYDGTFYPNAEGNGHYGKGKMIHGNRASYLFLYEGEWKISKTERTFHGNGKLTYSNGNYEEGRWIEGKKEGYFRVYNSSKGTYSKVKFDDGEPVGKPIIIIPETPHPEPQPESASKEPLMPRRPATDKRNAFTRTL